MPAADYVEGVVVFAAMLAGVVAGAWGLQGATGVARRGAAGISALGVLVAAGLLFVHLAPAACGLLSRPAVLVASLLWCLAGVAAGRRWPALPDRDVAGWSVPRTTAERTAAGIALAVLAIGGAYVVAVLANRIATPAGGIDFVNFHLPNVVRWIETGSIWQIDVFLPGVSPGHYPNNGDVLLLAAVLPWHNDFLAHLALLPFYLLTGIATYALAGEIGARWWTAAPPAVALLLIPAVSIPALVSNLVDVLALFGIAAGLLFLIRHHRRGGRGELVLAGLALGIAFGTKWYAVSSVAVVIAVWALTTLAAGRRPAAVARQGAALVGLVALGGGIWLLRNWIESANPLYPVRVAPLGVSIFEAPPDPIRDLAGFTIADYLGQPQVMADYVLPQLAAAWALPGALLLAAVPIAAAVAIARRSSAGDADRRGLVLAGAVLALGLLAVYAITPYTAGGPEGKPTLVGADSRYGIPAMVAAAPLAAWCAGRLRWGPALLAGLALAGVLDGIRLTDQGEGSSATLEPGDWLVGAVVVAVAALAVLAIRRFRRGRLAWTNPAVVGAVAVLAALALVAFGYRVQQRFNSERYLGADPTIDALLARAPSGVEVGLANVWSDAGISPVLPAFGPRFGNQVEYVGRLDRSTLREFENRDAFAAALRRGGYDYLFVGTGIPPEPSPEEVAWARSAGYRPIAASDRLVLMRAPGDASGAR